MSLRHDQQLFLHLSFSLHSPKYVVNLLLKPKCKRKKAPEWYDGFKQKYKKCAYNPNHISRSSN